MKYMKDAIYGGVDGILSAFNFLVIMQSAHFPRSLILVILILKLLSDGVSISLSNYSGNSADAEMREAMQVDNEEVRIEESPKIAGLVTLIGFLVMGSLPILIYHYLLHDAGNIWVTTAVVLSVIFVLGMVKSAVIYKDIDTVAKGGAQFAIVGVIGVAASILIGKMIHAIVGHKYASMA